MPIRWRAHRHLLVGEGLPRGRADQRVEHAVGVLDFDDVGMAGLVEGGSGKDQDGGVDQQGQGQRTDCINST